MQLNESNFQFLNEAEFRRENIARVMQLYRKLFGKYFGGEFKIIAEESYKKMGEKGSGIRLMNDLNYQLRFNWAFKESNDLKKQNQSDKTKLYISSIDYWEPINTDFEKPSTTVKFLMNVNVVQIWKGLAKVIKKGIRGKYTLNDLKVDISDLTEDYNLNRAQRKDFLMKAAGFEAGKAYFTGDKEFKSILKDSPELQSKLDEYCIELGIGKKETNSTGEKLRQSEKELNDKVYSDPEFVFQDIEDLATLVAKGKCKSLIICGMGGIGKTFHVTKTLKEILGADGTNWHYHSGMKASAVSFYMKAYQERNEIIVWDEADSLLLNDDIVMMLKPALDTFGENTMEYSRGKSTTGWSKSQIEDYCREVDDQIADGKMLSPTPSKGDYVHVPGKFYFKGSMIFISNMPAKKIEGAILSRSMFIDVHLCAKDVQKRIMSIMKVKYKNYSDKELQMFADAMGGFASGKGEEPIVYMTPEYARKNKPVTIRSMELAIVMKEAGLKNWVRLASLYS